MFNQAIIRNDETQLIILGYPSKHRRWYFRKGSPPKSNMNSIEMLYKEVLGAGNHLENALSIEHYFCLLLKDYPTDEVKGQWTTARRLVEEAAQEYSRATARLREALNSGQGFEGSSTHLEGYQNHSK